MYCRDTHTHTQIKVNSWINKWVRESNFTWCALKKRKQPVIKSGLGCLFFPRAVQNDWASHSRSGVYLKLWTRRATNRQNTAVVSALIIYSKKYSPAFCQRFKNERIVFVPLRGVFFTVAMLSVSEHRYYVVKLATGLIHSTLLRLFLSLTQHAIKL